MQAHKFTMAENEIASSPETCTKKEPLFKELNPDEDDNGVMEIESLCLNCHQQGTTRLMLTRIPFFREVILSSFSCDDCGYSDTGIQSGGKIQDKGVKYMLQVTNPKDLDRRVIKSDFATFKIPSIDFEQPPSKKGEITTLEGLINAVIEGLQSEQPIRKALDPPVAAKIDDFIHKLETLKELKQPFTVILEDPTGNSYIENPNVPQKDPEMTITHFTRTRQQDIDIGLASEEDDEQENIQNEEKEEEIEEEKESNFQNEVLGFQTNCPSCNSPCETNMKIQDIPFFKETIIMSTVCDVCGLRENEVKGGSGISEKGATLNLRITDPTDLSRDVLKSDTCGVQIPEIGLELVEGTLGGKFTTLEGLLRNIRDQLGSSNPFIVGDSSEKDSVSKMDQFIEKLEKVINGEMLGVHFILDDPAGNSYIQNVFAPDPDPELQVTYYERSFEQNELLGLNDMVTEGYEGKDTS